MLEECPHRNPTIRDGGPYYRQVHPNNFQEGRALSPAFLLRDTGCHLALSLNDGARTTAERCYAEYTRDGERSSAAVLEIIAQELQQSGTNRIVDSPNAQTYAHADATYEKPMSRCQQRNVAQSLSAAANRRGPAVTVQTWGDEVEAGTLRNNDLSTIRRLSDAFYPPSKAYVPSTLNSYPTLP